MQPHQHDHAIATKHTPSATFTKASRKWIMHDQLETDNEGDNSRKNYIHKDDVRSSFRRTAAKEEHTQTNCKRQVIARKPRGLLVNTQPQHLDQSITYQVKTAKTTREAPSDT